MKGSVGRQESAVFRLSVYVVVSLGALPVLLPAYWIVLASLKSRERISVSPPEWLPLNIRHTISIAGQQIPVVVFDDAGTSRTGVPRVKMKHGATLQLPRRDLEQAVHVDYFAPVDGVDSIDVAEGTDRCWG